MLNNCMDSPSQLRLFTTPLILSDIHVYLVLFSDFCNQGDGYTRGDNSVCESPSGDNGVRTGLVVGYLLSSVLVVLVWIILVLLWNCGTKNMLDMYMYM